MERFEFVDKEEERGDARVNFVNNICKLIYNKHKGNLEEVINDESGIIKGLYDHIGNAYELEEHHAPLLAVYALKKNGAENYGFSDDEFKAALCRSVEACKDYFTD